MNKILDKTLLFLIKINEEKRRREGNKNETFN